MIEKKEFEKLKITLEEWFDNLKIEEKINIIASAYLNKKEKKKGGEKMIGKIISLVFGLIIGLVVGTLFGREILEFIILKLAGS